MVLKRLLGRGIVTRKERGKLWNLECPVGLSQKRICAHFNERILTQFVRFAKTIKTIVELRSVFELVGRK